MGPQVESMLSNVAQTHAPFALVCGFLLRSEPRRGARAHNSSLPAQGRLIGQAWLTTIH